MSITESIESTAEVKEILFLIFNGEIEFSISKILNNSETCILLLLTNSMKNRKFHCPTVTERKIINDIKIK